MIQNFLYTLFFGIVNLFIYSKLIRKTKIKWEGLIYSLIALILVIHLGIFKVNDIMPTKDFFNISFFSLALIILHYLTNIQVKLFKKYSVPQEERGKKLQLRIITIFNFMRQKLIYIMIYISQILDIWNESYR